MLYCLTCVIYTFTLTKKNVRAQIYKSEERNMKVNNNIQGKTHPNQIRALFPQFPYLSSYLEIRFSKQG